MLRKALEKILEAEFENHWIAVKFEDVLSLSYNEVKHLISEVLAILVNETGVVKLDFDMNEASIVYILPCIVGVALSPNCAFSVCNDDNIPYSSILSFKEGRFNLQNVTRDKSIPESIRIGKLLNNFCHKIKSYLWD